uniref:Uncharacterized protein n=1 Tax=Plectus sambesii TaxID=2011161 RepID=A0A914VMI3_9BILA
MERWAGQKLLSAAAQPTGPNRPTLHSSTHTHTTRKTVRTSIAPSPFTNIVNRNEIYPASASSLSRAQLTILVRSRCRFSLKTNSPPDKRPIGYRLYRRPIVPAQLDNERPFVATTAAAATNLLHGLRKNPTDTQFTLGTGE